MLRFQNQQILIEKVPKCQGLQGAGGEPGDLEMLRKINQAELYNFHLWIIVTCKSCKNFVHHASLYCSFVFTWKE